MTQIIYSCNNGLVTEGMVKANAPIRKSKVFIDHPMNLLGFRRSLKTHSKGNIDYYEIGYFMEMLYNGSHEAFKIMKTKDEDIDFCFFDFDLLKKEEEHLVSRALVDSLTKEADYLFAGLEDPEELSIKATEKNNKFLIEKLGYNNLNAYICLRNLMLAENVLKHSVFDYGKISTNTLQAVLDGKFSIKAISDGYEDYKQRINKLEETSNLLLRPDLEVMDEILHNIRNVKVETLNIERL